jgi:hypothetical protein
MNKGTGGKCEICGEPVDPHSSFVGNFFKTVAHTRCVRMNRMPKTVRPKEVVIDGKGYDKCPHPRCDHMVEILGYNPASGYRTIKFASTDPDADIYAHIKQAHGYVWVNAGGRGGGWYPVGKFFHPRPEIK